MTAQFREQINIDGQIYGMVTEPLEDYLVKNFYGKDDGTYPQLEAFSTACWRGYIGSWLIENNQLFLIDLSNHYFSPSGNYDGVPRIYVRVGDNEVRTMADWRKSFFTSRQGNIKAEWFTGELTVEMGDLVEYVHQGYASMYEKYMKICVENGNVTFREIINNKPENKKT